ncbi:unnamed protein product [Thelazia callipaeda]|uniref:TYR_PHOSPHATASE_2 domain-containing protein n=1 Tax=Thelazia callipaeda TaxID=103827 RepID=A0A0N5CNA6_THECL|nr:unnamed protein product [Thelazia callipaeda]
MKGIQNSGIIITVAPSYSAIRYGILRITPGSLRCKLYCRGTNCKYCSWKSWSTKQQAIHGLYSSWITKKIIAMSRPTVKTFAVNNLITQLHRTSICTVISLQMPGEHESCGPKLLSSGFTYNPEEFMQNGIQFYNFVWPDFGTLGIEMLLDIVKVVHLSLKLGKVAIHCHAGLGRTGVVIGAYLIWAKNYTYAEAIGYVRNARCKQTSKRLDQNMPNSVQTKKQINLMRKFELYLEKNGAALPEAGRMHLSDYLKIQRQILSSGQARKYHHIPKVLHAAMKELLLAVYGELNGRTRRWITDALKSVLPFDQEFHKKGTLHLPAPAKTKSEELDICISGVIENGSEVLSSNYANGKKCSNNTFKINNCAKFIRSRFRGNMLQLVNIIDRLMNSIIKPVIPKEFLVDNPWHTSEDVDWYCLHRYLLLTMVPLGNGNHKNIGRLMNRWYLGKSNIDYSDEFIIALHNQVSRT